jgi:GNAT superfamily N-acetyltransferase
MDIDDAHPCDAGEILALQKLAFLSEARLYNDYSLPPNTQTRDEMGRDIANMTVLKATEGGSIIGSVRGAVDSGICLVGRLVVHPAHQRKGIGMRLMAVMEERFARSCECFEIFTGHKSIGALSLYAKLGYSRYRAVPLHDGLTMIFLRKPAQASPRHGRGEPAAVKLFTGEA